jgi:hypothetical protein
LKPEANESSSQHLKVFFARGNEHLTDAGEEVGGARVYGGAILSKNPKNNVKWLKVNGAPRFSPFLASHTWFKLQSKHFAGTHLGNDFHIYELLWTPTEITLSIDGVAYGSLSSNLRESAMVAKIKSAVNWANNGPFDKEVGAAAEAVGWMSRVITFALHFQHFLSINVAAGSVKNFYSINGTLANGAGGEAKPWSDTGWWTRARGHFCAIVAY